MQRPSVTTEFEDHPPQIRTRQEYFDPVRTEWKTRTEGNAKASDLSENITLSLTRSVCCAD